MSGAKLTQTLLTTQPTSYICIIYVSRYKSLYQRVTEEKQA